MLTYSGGIGKTCLEAERTSFEVCVPSLSNLIPLDIRLDWDRSDRVLSICVAASGPEGRWVRIGKIFKAGCASCSWRCRRSRLANERPQ
jgi:hypothetical protein